MIAVHWKFNNLCSSFLKRTLSTSQAKNKLSKYIFKPLMLKLTDKSPCSHPRVILSRPEVILGHPWVPSDGLNRYSAPENFGGSGWFYSDFTFNSWSRSLRPDQRIYLDLNRTLTWTRAWKYLVLCHLG